MADERATPLSSSDLIGRTVSHYKVESHLGEGGMGVVYRALDTILGRPVAIKVLPDRCARDPGRRARFEREAKLLASLDHRNIGAIHGMEMAGDLCFLILELIPGTTLASRLAKDPPDLPESLEIARQMADALETAHEKGVVHRDLKPGNVMITPEGVVKVLDFGLAKALQTDASANDETDPTLTLDQTEPGVILGTAAYMSPEQARGHTVDKRADIWAFGAVLYEMVARRRAFRGETLSDLIAVILCQEPDWNAIPDGVPSKVVALLKRCLQKDPRQRLRDMGDARIELEDAFTAPAAVAEPAAPKPRRIALVLAGAIVGLALAAVAFLLLRPSPQAPLVTRFAIRLNPGEIIAPLGSSVRLSPDGIHLAWAAADAEGRTQLYHRSLSEMQATALPGTASGYAPFFSPDGSSLAFLHAGSRTVKKLALSGGAPSLLSPYAASSGPGVWGPQDSVYMTLEYPGPLVKVAAAGGAPKPVTTLDSKRDEVIHTRPVLLPGGKAILFAIGGGGMDSYDDARIAVQSLETGERKILIEGGMAPAYSPTGHIIYAHDGKLLAVPFDLKRLAVAGSPVPVLEGVFMCISTGSAHYSLAANGTLAYAPGIVLGGVRQLVWVDRTGKAEVVPTPARAYLHPRISPDGGRLAVEVEGPMHDFWSYDLARGIMTKMTTDGISHWPVWSADGTRLTFRRWINNYFTMWWSPADRSAPPERLTDIGRTQSPASWSPDGRVIAFTQVSPDTGADVYVLDIGDRKPRPFVQTRFAEGSPKFSPDGRWIAYTSNESGRNEIYVQAYPGPGPKIQVSVEGGTDAVWRFKGGELYYRDSDKMMVVQVSTSGSFQSSKPRVLWSGHYAQGLGSQCGPPGTTSSNYDVTPDGERFLMIKQDEVAPAQIYVVLNWTEEMMRTLRTKRL